MKHLTKTSAFTLIELVVSVTILSIIMLSVFVVYSDLIQVNKRLEALRMVGEDMRTVTEKIASDVREKWIDFTYYDWSSVERTSAYSGSGNLVLAIQWGVRYYPMKDSLAGPTLCHESDLTNLATHCYIGREQWGERIALTTANVRIEDIRFFFSGTSKDTATNLSNEGKVTIVTSMGIEKKSGVSDAIVQNTHMRIQTTVSEKIYKKN